jgi:hypothetical protein
MTNAEKDIVREKKIPLVGKLLSLATSDNEHEAEAALTQANLIMEQFNISKAEAMAASVDKITWEISTHRVWNVPFQFVDMYFKLANFCDGRGVSNRSVHNEKGESMGWKRNRRDFTFYGTDEDFLNFKAVTENAVKFIERMVKKEKKLKGWADRSYFTAYKLGLASGIAAVAYDLTAEREKRYKKQAESTALVLADKKDAIEKIYPKNLGTHSGSSFSNANGFHRGHAVGKTFQAEKSIRANGIKQLKN